MAMNTSWSCESKGGRRYYLAEMPIHAGELLELLLDDGLWALGRFEWNYQKEDRPWF